MTAQSWNNAFTSYQKHFGSGYNERETYTLHENIDGIWFFGENKNEKSLLINNTTSNLKRFWCPEHVNINWFSEDKNFLEEFLHQSTQIKNIWIPYGE